MRIFICVVAVTAFALTGMPSAHAGAEAGQGYFSIMGSYIDDDSGRGLEDAVNLSLIHISEPTRQLASSRMPSSA